MVLYENTDSHTRIWLTLINPLTGTTLELAPGAQVELADDSIQDQYLKPVPLKTKHVEKATSVESSKDKE